MADKRLFVKAEARLYPTTRLSILDKAKMTFVLLVKRGHTLANDLFSQDTISNFKKHTHLKKT